MAAANLQISTISNDGDDVIERSVHISNTSLVEENATKDN